jgi:hypothetical protein
MATIVSRGFSVRVRRGVGDCRRRHGDLRDRLYRRQVRRALDRVRDSRQSPGSRAGFLEMDREVAREERAG